MKIILTKQEYELNKEVFGGSIKANSTEEELKELEEIMNKSKDMYSGMYQVEENDNEVIIHVTEDMTLQILEKSKDTLPAIMKAAKDFFSLYIKFATDLGEIIGKFIKY